MDINTDLTADVDDRLPPNVAVDATPSGPSRNHYFVENYKQHHVDTTPSPWSTATSSGVSRGQSVQAPAEEPRGKTRDSLVDGHSRHAPTANYGQRHYRHGYKPSVDKRDVFTSESPSTNQRLKPYTTPRPRRPDDRGPPAVQPPAHSAHSRHEPSIKCICAIPAKLLRIRKDEGFPERLAYICAKPSKRERCGFFQWADGKTVRRPPINAWKHNNLGVDDATNRRREQKTNDSMQFDTSKQKIDDVQADPITVLRDEIDKCRNLFIRATEHVNRIDEAVGKYVEKTTQKSNESAKRPDIPVTVMHCVKCGSTMSLRTENGNNGSTARYCSRCRTQTVDDRNFNAMSTKRHRSNAMSTERDRSNSMSTERHRSNSMSTERHRSNSMSTERHSFNAMSTERDRFKTRESNETRRQSNSRQNNRRHDDGNFKKKRRCRICRQTSHDRRTCPLNLFKDL